MREAEIKKEILARCLWAQRIVAHPETVDLNAAVADLERWIGYFQHERLIHLIVTALFAVLTMLSVLMLMISPSMTVIVLIVLMVALLLFYIRHYYLLENKTQTLYSLMDRILEIKKEKG
jgi:ABC-type bacteriocin/lantibiotic exporter with double-glycine peptidase domain